MRYLKITILLLIVNTFFTGCACLFSSGKQRVQIISATPGATIKYRGDTLGTTSASLKVKKRKVYHQFVLEKEGYKTKHYAIGLNKRSATYTAAILDAPFILIGWMCYAFLDSKEPTTYRYAKTQQVPAMVRYEPRDNEKYLSINKTSFEASKKDIVISKYKSIKSFVNDNATTAAPKKQKKNSRDAVKEGISIENTIFTDVLDSRLKKLGFIDTTDKVMNYNNSVYLNATVKKIGLNEIVYKHEVVTAASMPNVVMCARLEIEWELLDHYKQKIYTTSTNILSDYFVVDNQNPMWGPKADSSTSATMEKAIYRAIEDNMEYSLIEVRNQLKEKGYLKIGSGSVMNDTTAKSSVDTTKPIVIDRPASKVNSKMNEFLRSSVTVKVDNGHGSGVIITKDGYVVTNYHVIAGTKKIEIIYNDGTKSTAEIIRSRPDIDLALLKIADKTDLLPLEISEAQEKEAGIDVWAIGTPRSIELGQSVSRGIISGTRKRDGISYIQTDVKINPGNSGGALINKEGVVLGIVSLKYTGEGVEGIGFAINSTQIFTKLGIKYKE